MVGKITVVYSKKTVKNNLKNINYNVYTVRGSCRSTSRIFQKALYLIYIYGTYHSQTLTRNEGKKCTKGSRECFCVSTHAYSYM